MKDIKALLPDYALGLLDPEDASEVERFLETCESCQIELSDYNSMFVTMVETLPTLEPKTQFATLKDLISTTPDKASAQFHEQASYEAVATPREKRSALPSSASSVSKVSPKALGQVRSERAGSSRALWSGWQRGLSAWRYQTATLALTLGLLAASVWGWGQYQAGSEARHAQTLMTSWLASGAARQPLLSETGEALGSLLIQDNHALVVLFEPPAPEHVYQVWGEVDKTCTSLTISDSNVFEVDWQADMYSSIVVSSEPLGGSEDSTDVLAQVPLPRR